MLKQSTDFSQKGLGQNGYGSCVGKAKIGRDDYCKNPTKYQRQTGVGFQRKGFEIFSLFSTRERRDARSVKTPQRRNDRKRTKRRKATTQVKANSPGMLCLPCAVSFYLPCRRSGGVLTRAGQVRGKDRRFNCKRQNLRRTDPRDRDTQGLREDRANAARNPNPSRRRTGATSTETPKQP